MKTKLLILIIAFVASTICNVNAQWQPTNGPYGVEVMSVEKSGAYLFAGVKGGVMVTTNNGNIWKKSLQVDSAFALKYNGSNLYAGTESGFYLSTNNGVSWTQSNAGLTNTTILSFAVNGTSLFAGTRGGVFISTNNGTSWSSSNIGMPSTSVNAFLIDGINFFAGTNQGVYRSTNNGLTWNAMNTGMTAGEIATSFAINGTNIFVGVYNYLAHEIYLTTNDGISWTNVDIGGPITFAGPTFVSKIGTKIFAGSTYGIYESIDNGTTWTPNNNSFLHAIKTFFSDGANLYDGGTGGLNVTTDFGNSWDCIGLGYANCVNALASNGTKIFAASSNGIYFTSDGGNNWEKSLFPSVDNSIPREFNAIAVNGSNVFASTDNNYPLVPSLFRSVDNGINWEEIMSNSFTPNDTVITAIGIWASKVFIGAVTGLYSSLDNGNSWTLLTNGLPTGGYPYYTIISSGPVIFASNTSGTYLSTDGVNWSLTISAGSVVLAANGPNIYATDVSGDYIYISNNYGSTWTSSYVDFMASVKSLVVKGDTLISLGTISSQSNWKGAYISADNGITWNSIINGIQDCNYMGSLIINGSNVFAASGAHWGLGMGMWDGCDQQNNGVFCAGLSSLVSGIQEANENSALLLYPNPASSNLTIKTSPKLIGANYFIYDMTGRVVMQGKLTNEILNFSINAITPGFYLFQIDGFKSQSVKLIKN